MSLDNPRAGYGSAIEFQTSALPYVTSGVAPSVLAGNVQRIDFPKITRFITITNNEASGTYLRVGFSNNSVFGSDHIRVNGGQTITLQLRITSLYIAGDIASVQFALCAGLTNIDSIQMASLANPVTPSTTFTPMSLSPSPAVWLRADLGITLVTGVSQWADQSGNGRNLIQNTGANQPAFLTSAINNQPAINFTTNGHFLQSASLFGLDMSGDYTFYIVAQLTQANDSNYHNLFYINGTGAVAAQVYAPHNDNKIHCMSSGISGGGDIAFSTAVQGVPYLFGVRAINGAGATKNRVNSVVSNSTRAGATVGSTLALNLGAVNNAALQQWKGYVAEWVIYQRVISVTEETQLLSYFSNRYGQSWT